MSLITNGKRKRIDPPQYSPKRERPLQPHTSDMTGAPQKEKVETPEILVARPNDGAARQARSERRAKKSKPSRESQDENGTFDHSTGTPLQQQTQVPETPESITQTVLPEDSAFKSSSTSGLTHKKPARFIVFVGNLPFSTTNSAIKAHFSKLGPASIRHSTDSRSGKSKGFAFVEFDHYDKLKTCLKLYHHSWFDPGKMTSDKGDRGDADTTTSLPSKDHKNTENKLGNDLRRINVELTAGGGGRSSARKDRIKSKNQKLNDQRKKPRSSEDADRYKKKQKGQAVGAAAMSLMVNGEAAQRDQVSNDGDHQHIHPSRRKRMKG